MQLFQQFLPKKKSKEFEQLKKKWSKRQQTTQSKLWNKHQEALQWWHTNFSPRQLAAGSVGGLMLLTAPTTLSLPAPQALAQHQSPIDPVDNTALVAADLTRHLPSEVRALTPDEEASIAAELSQDYGMTVKPDINGLRLNRTYGYIGQEQHLARYPGDTMDTHLASPADEQAYAKYGMAPGLGAWGYFAPSKEAMTEEDSQREKYYIAVQTFLAPQYMERVSEYRDFFKYRKMLVVNPNNGHAVVAVIGDAGPAEWTGKQLGGSPEVMQYLERKDGKQKGPVLYFFIEDPNNSIPLGPVSVQ